MMKIEFVMILALCISGMINYLVSWLTDNERVKNNKIWGRSEPSNIKDFVIATIFFLVLVALGSNMFFGMTEKVDIGYTVYVALFESFMISLYLSIKFIEKKGDLKRFEEILNSYVVLVPLVAYLVLFAFILTGYVDIGDPYGITYSFALLALAMIVVGVLILAAEAVYFFVKDIAKIENWMQKILYQKKKMFYTLIVTTIIALALTM